MINFDELNKILSSGRAATSTAQRLPVFPAPVAWTEGRRAGETTTLMLRGGATLEMVWCPATTSEEWKRISGGKDYFVMGSPKGEAGEGETYARINETQHQVTLTEGFWMANYPLTQAQWMSVMGYNLSDERGNDLPVGRISWVEAQEFCRKTGLALPTEAQWEYACRAGTTGAYAGTGRLEDMGWYGANSGHKMHPVGRKQPNAWGLYDMHGNVHEWCADWHGDYSGGAVTNPTGPGSGSCRVCRGGCAGGAWWSCRSAWRYCNEPNVCGYDDGFRPVRILPR